MISAEAARKKALVVRDKLATDILEQRIAPSVNRAAEQGNFSTEQLDAELYSIELERKLEDLGYVVVPDSNGFHITFEPEA